MRQHEQRSRISSFAALRALKAMSIPLRVGAGKKVDDNLLQFGANGSTTPGSLRCANTSDKTCVVVCSSWTICPTRSIAIGAQANVPGAVKSVQIREGTTRVNAEYLPMRVNRSPEPMRKIRAEHCKS